MKKLLILLAIISLPSFAAVPSDSRYNTDTTNIFLEDPLNDATDTPNMILCFMGNVGVNLMLNQGNFKALVNDTLCDQGGRTKSGPQSSDANAAASQNAQSSAPEFIEVVGNGTRADNSSPMIGKVWVPNASDMDGDGTDDPMTIYTLTTVTSSPSTSLPYGVFNMDYTALLDGSDSNLMEGLLKSDSEGALTWIDSMAMGGSTIINKLYLQKTSDTVGKGVIQWPKFDQGENPNLYVYAFGYDADTYCRQEISKNGAAASDDGVYCYDTRKSEGIKGIFRYGLYDSSTGARHNLTTGGFPVTTTISSVKRFGFADYWGVHFPAAVISTFVNGTTLTRDMGPGVAGEDYTLSIGGNKLRKITMSHVSLDSLDSLTMNSYFETNSNLGITSTGEFQFNYDKTNDRFSITHARNYNTSPPTDAKLGSAINFTRAAWLTEYPNNGMGGYIKGFGSVYISTEAITTPSSTTTNEAVFLETEVNVLPADYPAKLYCVNNCFSAATISAFITSLSGSALTYGPYTEATYRQGSVDTAEVVTYTKNDLNYQTSSADAVWPTLTQAQQDAMGGTDHRWGSYTGPLVTDVTSFACPENHTTSTGDEYCEWSLRNNNVTTFYKLTSGYQRWDKKWLLTDASGDIVDFSEPTPVYYQVPTGAAYGDYSAEEVGLDYNSFGSLHGFPGSCYNTTTGAFTDNCNTGSGWYPWVSRFDIPVNETTGVVYSARGQAGTKYLVRQLEGVVYLAPVVNPGNITIGDASLLPSDSLVDVGPNGGDNYIGAKPDVTGSVSVIHGVKQ